MAALLVAMAVMAVVMSVLLPVWHTLSVREKEEELMFRKKFKDPITNDDFDFVGVSAGQPNAPGVQAPNMPGAPQQSSPGVQQPPRGFGQLIGSVRSKSKAHSFREPDGATTYDKWQFTYVPWKPAGQAVPQTPGGGQGMPKGPGFGTRPGTQRPGGRGTGRGSGGTSRGPSSGVVVPVDAPPPPPTEP